MFRVEGHHPFSSWTLIQVYLNCAQFTRFATTLILCKKKIQKNTSMCTQGLHAYSTRCLLANLVTLVVLVALAGTFIHSRNFHPRVLLKGFFHLQKLELGGFGYPKDVQLPWEQITSWKLLYWPTDLYSLSVPISSSFILWEVSIPAKAPFPGSLITHPSWSSCHGDSIRRWTPSYPISFNSYLPLA